MAEKREEFICDFKEVNVTKFSINGTKICSSAPFCDGWECSLKKSFNKINPDDLLSGTSLEIFSPFSPS